MKKKKLRVINLVLFFLFVSIFDFCHVYLNFRDKFQDVTIEVGTEEIKTQDFLVSKMYEKRSNSITDLRKIDLTEVGEYDIELSYGRELQTVKLNIVDTTAPEVTFEDLVKGLDYKYNYEDFVVLVKDKSDYNITSDVEKLDVKLGQYKINVTVSDIYGNETSKICNLSIKLVYDEITHELGEPLEKSEILLSENYGNKEITNDILNQVNIDKIGTYDLKFTYKKHEYKTKVKIEDTVGPKIVVNNITFYLGSKEKKEEDFIKSVIDPSGVKDIKYEGKLDFKTLGVQELKIIATDNLGNVSEEVATLTVKDDNIGPVITGLSTLTINKHEKVDYLKGVKAVDEKDGDCEVAVDSSKVNTNSFGIYYAVYTSKDKSNNITTKKRKIIVKYDSDDLEETFNDYFNKHLTGKSVLQIVKYIRNNISYRHYRGSDPLYSALVEKTGSCYGHALMVKKALDKLGIPNYMINTMDASHYWNLVYDNGVWRHFDATPGSHSIGQDTDNQKLASKAMRGRVWNRTLYPEAN